MKLQKYSILAFLFCFLSLGLEAQEAEQVQTIDDGSIKDQFEFVISKSTNWKDERGRVYEVVRRSMFQTLQAHTVDTLNTIKAKLNQTNQQIATQQNEINTLQADLSNVKQTLEATNQEKDSMAFLGMPMSKTGYNMLVWSIIAIITGLLAFFIFRFQSSNVLTKEAKSNLSKVESEFEQHRKKVLEREQKLKRQLQDELNKHSS